MLLYFLNIINGLITENFVSKLDGLPSDIFCKFFQSIKVIIAYIELRNFKSILQVVNNAMLMVCDMANRWRDQT